MVGPGVANHGLDGPPATFRPDPTLSVPAQLDRRNLVRPHRHPPDDVCAPGPEGQLRRRRPGSHRDPEAVIDRSHDGHPTTSRWPSATSSSTPASAASARQRSSATRLRLKSGSTGSDSQYATFSAKLAELGARRDALATPIKQDLAPSGHGNHLSHDANRELSQCNRIIRQAEALANIPPSA